ncbi:MAG: putative toxin-antitoxin system toxin component, PIN family [Bacteroidales bacterium]|nr:putative toxin-antitoxin system toxin component, PIN family [Bacteroidales bacterium]
MRYVVVDTNCLLRMIPLRSKYRPTWESFLDGKYFLCISNDIVSEYIEILTSKVSSTFAENIVGAILRSPFVRRFDPQFHFNLIEADPDDNKFVDCAIIANADFIVSEDSHFRVLKTISFPKVNVLTLDEFSEELK